MEPTEFAGTKENAIPFGKYLINTLYRWPFVLGFLVASLLVAYAINYYQDPIYSIKAKIITKKYSNTSTSPVPGMVDASFFTKGTSEIYEEIPTLKSPKRIEATVDRLDYRVSYFSVGVIKTVESLKGFGFDVEVDSIDESNFPFNKPIYYNQNDAQTYQLLIEDAQWNEQVKDKKFRFGIPFKIGSTTLRVLNTNGSKSQRNTFYFVINRKSDVVNRYRAQLNIDWSIKGSSLLDLYMESQFPARDLEFLNAFYKVTMEAALKEKNETLDNTISFIDAQMNLIGDSLFFYERLIDSKKVENLQLNIAPELVYGKFSELDLKEEQINLNNLYLSYLNSYFTKNKNNEVLAPSIEVETNTFLLQWMTQYVTDKLNEQIFKNNENSNNPLINREDSLRRKLTKGIYESIASSKERNKEGAELVRQNRMQLLQSIKKYQDDYRDLSHYQRLYQLNQTIFDLFLQRKIEASISKASATSDYKIIESPAASANPIKPNKLLNYLVAAILGLLIPISFFLIRDITNPSIKDRDDLKANLDMPMLGYVPHSLYEPSALLANHPRSLVTEAFRAIRASLRYVKQEEIGQGIVYLLTSSVAGEGKTFCSINMAQSFVMSGKKTLLIGADLRKSSFKDYIEIKQDKGLAEYLAGMIALDKIIIKEDNFPDFIYSGHIPPNPSELLGSETMKNLVAHLRTLYDYIIIDTPPIGIVSDAVELLKLSNSNFLVVRQGVTQKIGLKMINELYIDGKLPNFFSLFNDVKISGSSKGRYGFMYGLGYGGYGYGYYEEDDKKSKSRV